MCNSRATKISTMDVSLFAASRAFGCLSAGGAVTLDLSAQFMVLIFVARLLHIA